VEEIVTELEMTAVDQLNPAPVVDGVALRAGEPGPGVKDLLTGIHPALERAIGPKVSHPAVLEILSRCGGPAGIAKAGRRKLTAIAKVHARRMGDKLIDSIMTALGEQTVTVPGTAAADTLSRRRRSAGWPTDHSVGYAATTPPCMGRRCGSRGQAPQPVGVHLHGFVACGAMMSATASCSTCPICRGRQPDRRGPSGNCPGRTRHRR
jgi:hypothetical protein